MRLKMTMFQWSKMDLEWHNICRLMPSTFWGTVPCYKDFCIQSESDQTQYTARQIKLSMGTQQKSYIQISMSFLQNKHIEVHNLPSPLSSIFLDKYIREYLWALCKIERILAKFLSMSWRDKILSLSIFGQNSLTFYFRWVLVLPKRSLRC